MNELADFVIIYADKIDDTAEIHAHYTALLANCHGLKKQIKANKIFRRRLKSIKEPAKSHYRDWKQADLQKLWNEIIAGKEVKNG